MIKTEKQREAINILGGEATNIMLYGGGRCLHYNTDVLTDEGYKAISTLNIGDLVASVNNNNDIEYRYIVNKYVKKAGQAGHKVVIFVFNNQKIICSYEHRLFFEGKYVSAIDIARRIMERNQWEQREVSNIELWPAGEYGSQGSKRAWKSSNNEASYGRQWVSKDDDCHKWEVQNYQNAQDYCSTLDTESGQQATNKPYKPYQSGQSHYESGMGDVQREYRPHDEGWPADTKQGREKRVCYHYRRIGQRSEKGISKEAQILHTGGICEHVQSERNTSKGYNSPKMLDSCGVEAREIYLTHYYGCLYDIEVEGNHNYLITTDNIISHNSGKTAIFIYSILVRACKAKSRHVILRQKFNHCKQTIWLDTLPKVAKMLKIPYQENRSDFYYTLHNGSEIWIGGLDDKDRTEKILGAEFSTIYLNEVSQMSYDSVGVAKTRLAEKTILTNKMYYDCNPPTKSHWVYSLFFKGIDPVTKEAINKDNYVSMLMNPIDNVSNLSDDYLKILESLPFRQRQRFLYGVFLDDIEGALWKETDIDNNRLTIITAPKGFKRKVIAVDPAMSYGEDSDETGIIVAAKGHDDHYYVLNDLSGKYAPGFWGSLVASTYKSEMCSNVVAEVNQGGELVTQNIRQIDRAISVKTVHASQGKLTRAEPVAALYEQGLVHHIGRFPELEEQQTTYTGRGMKSPDRMDALVYAITELNESTPLSYWS